MVETLQGVWNHYLLSQSFTDYFVILVFQYLWFQISLICLRNIPVWFFQTWAGILRWLKDTVKSGVKPAPFTAQAKCWDYCCGSCLKMLVYLHNLSTVGQCNITLPSVIQLSQVPSIIWWWSCCISALNGWDVPRSIWVFL